MEKLPESVDVIVLGTGLLESVIAAACSRSGLSVLHLDRTEFYGGDWSSFNLRSINEWLTVNSEEKSDVLEPEYEKLLSDGETLVQIVERNTIANIQTSWNDASEETTEVKVKDETMQMTHKEFLQEKEWRKFSIDMVPKVLLARGPMVQTLCDSEVAKYAEFKCVDRFLCFDQNAPKTEAYSRVPCSKGDIFVDDKLNMIDKRRLMKFLTYCLQWNTNADSLNDWQNYQDKSFSEFLNTMGITGTLQQYVADAIGILHPNANTKEGLTAVCKFIDSVGRFGTSPFLTPLYGCGELSQCFCRLCAVFGGLYCLGRRIEALIYKDDKCVGVIADGQAVRCTQVIMSPKYSPKSSNDSEKSYIHRSVHITKESVFEENKEHVSLVNLSSIESEACVRYFENGFEVCAAPKGYYLSNFTGKGSMEKLKEVEKKILASEEGEGPKPLWSLYFSILTSVNHDKLPENVTEVSGPDHSLDFATVISEAQRIFSSLWPERDFLPRSLKQEDEESDVPPIGEEMQSE
ncbi:unnamed protein product [Auanema sp. JU1783]|nr:unnamed protein product [Auanema sp. JU1783]